MSGLDLLPAGQVHVDLLAGMHAICFAHPWSAESLAAVLAMPGAEGLIAVDGGSLAPNAGAPGPAGFVLWRRALDEAEILTICVLPPWRGQGLGRRMLLAAMAGARETGCLTMFLEVAADNTGALSLYRGEAFQEIGLRKGYYRGVDAMVMRKELV